MPIVSPLLICKSIFSRLSTLASFLYEKLTLSKSMLPSAGVMSFAFSSSSISIFSSRTSTTRSIDARDITIVIKTIATIISDISICIT